MLKILFSSLVLIGSQVTAKPHHHVLEQTSDCPAKCAADFGSCMLVRINQAFCKDAEDKCKLACPVVFLE